MPGQSAFHEDFSRSDQLRPGGSDRSFGFVFTAVFAILALWPLRRGLPVRWWSLVLSGVFLIVTLVLPGLLHPLNWLWTKIGLLLGRVMNPIILAVMFYAVFVPFKFFLSLARKDLLRLRTSEGESYWVTRTPPGPPPDSLRNQF
jgi:hypothetical protein